MTATPLLKTCFMANDETTNKLIESLYADLDKRRDGSEDKETIASVLSGILALRFEPEFAVNRRELNRSEIKAFEVIEARHIGSLLRRTKGKNRYAVSPELTQGTSVLETNPATLGFRVEHCGIRYTTPEAIQSPYSVSLINGVRALPCFALDIGTALEMQLQGLHFPHRYTSLVSRPLSVRALDLTASYCEFLDRELSKNNHLAIRLRNNTDSNRIAFVARQTLAIEFGTHLKNWTYRWTKEQGLKHFIPPVEVNDPMTGRTSINDGLPYQQQLEAMAGHHNQTAA